jgi:hypothetical protein
MMKPKRPQNISPHALACLEGIADARLGRVVSLGGALGLLHYIDYRPTKDVDAWWSEAAGDEERKQVLDVVERALASFGPVSRRAWGDVVSIELEGEGAGGFSFQVARRSAQLQPAAPAPWLDVLLDSLPDLLASKMVALVERGAPRDFRDIYTACQQGITGPPECWDLWRRRQEMAGSDTDRGRANLAIQTHLERIAKHRPLDTIEDKGQREAARSLRDWYRKEFLHVASD